MKKTSIKERLFRLLAYLLILVLLIVTVYPFIWMILNSFKSNAEIFRTPLALPKSWDLSVFKKAWTNYNLGRAYANSLKITAIAAAVLGGTSLTGGIGNMWGTLAGVLIIGLLNNGMDMLNIQSYIQDIVQGVIIVAAVLIDVNTNKESK